MRAYLCIPYYARQLSRCFIKIIIFNPYDKPFFFFFFLHETTGSKNLSDLVKVTQYESWTSVSPARGLSTKVTLHVQVSTFSTNSANSWAVSIFQHSFLP